MTVSVCTEVRLLMQSRNDLDRDQAVFVEAHLASCSGCRLAGEAFAAADVALLGYVDSFGPASSVVGGVHAQLRAQASRRRRRGRFLPRLPLSMLAIPLTLVAALVALATPQGAFGPRWSAQLAGADTFRLINPKIGFPVAVDGHRADHILLGAEGRIYESNNAGRSWHALAPLPPHLVIRAIVIDRAHPGRYLVAAERSIFLSVDGGSHWRVVASDLLGSMNMFLMQDPRVAERFYVGPSVLWASTDSGLTWHRTGRGLVFAPDGIQALAIRPDGVLATGIWQGGVALSPDAGIHWRRTARGLAVNVMDVAATSRALWAATDHGVYTLAGHATVWQRVGPRFFNSSLLVRGRTVLAGGDGALYRSDDAGRTWSQSMSGLPDAPYVAALVADPLHPNRVYASLNGDGVFRSDDGGRTWRGINAGVPTNAQSSPVHWVLFRRGGSLWITDVYGTDPGVLTVDSDVRAARMAPDARSVAYVAGSPRRWTIRLVSAGGSAARTLTSLAVSRAPTISWSRDASQLRIVTPRRIMLASMSRVVQSWVQKPGAITPKWARGNETVPALLHASAGASRGGRGCVLLEAQASTATRLAQCGTKVWEVDQRGHVLPVQWEIPAGAIVAPESSGRVLLFFAHGSLWRQAAGAQAQRIVADAEPA